MKTILFSFFLCTVAASCLDAQEIREAIPAPGGLINDVDQSTVIMHPATPFLETSSLLLADIDLEKIDVAAIANWAHEVMGSETSVDDTQTAAGFLASLKSGGVSHIYVAAATRSPHDGGPIVIIPCQNPAVVQGLASAIIQILPDPSQQKVHVGEKVVIGGAAVAVDRVVARKGTERADLILPLKGMDLLDHTIVLALPAESKEELSAMWPEQLTIEPLPNPISPRQIVGDVTRVILTLRLPPQSEMAIRVETIDASASERVKILIDDALSLLGDVRPLIKVEVDMASVSIHAEPESFLKLVSAILAPARAKTKQMNKMNSMKQLGLAIHNYHANEKHLPPRILTDAQGAPLLSWRVALLPHIDQLAMYRSMKLDQPWNSTDNQMASSNLIRTYCDDGKLGNKTTVRAPVFPGSLWDGDGPAKDFRDVTDGSSNTIALIDAPVSAAIEWSNPAPWVLSKTDPMSDVFGDRASATVLMLDGSVRVFSRDEMTNEKLKALLTIGGGEVIEP